MVDARADAVKLATHPEDSQYTLSGNTTGYSALHYNAKAQDRKEDAEKLAINPVDTQYTLEDGTTTGYSALHHATKAGEHNLDAEKLATNAEDSQFTLTDGTTGFSALHYQAKAQDNKDDAQKLAIEPEDSQFTLADGTTTGYSALHYAEKAADSATAAQTSANVANSPWTTNGTAAEYSAGPVKVTGGNHISVEGAGRLQIRDSSDNLVGALTNSTHSAGGLIATGATVGTILSGGQLGVYRGSGDPFFSFHHGDNSGARGGYIQSKNPSSNAIGNGLFINPEGTGKADYTTFGGKGFRNRGALQFLGSASSSSDIASIVVSFSSYGFDQNDFELVMIRMRNVGSTASSAVNFRFYFNGTVFSGSNYRYTSSRALYDGTTATNSNNNGWNATSGRFAYNHDSTSHDSWNELWIPNPGKNSYVSYSGTAYQIWWGFSRGVDGSSRPMVLDYAGYVNNTTSRTDVTGIWIDSSSGSFRQTQIEVYGLPRAGVGGVA